MSPLVLDKIKNANGHVKVVSTGDQFSIQILENNVWTSIFSNKDKNLCEQLVRKANSHVIFG